MQVEIRDAYSERAKNLKDHSYTEAQDLFNARMDAIRKKFVVSLSDGMRAAADTFGEALNGAMKLGPDRLKAMGESMTGVGGGFGETP